jgi:hypothetical protein
VIHGGGKGAFAAGLALARSVDQEAPRGRRGVVVNNDGMSITGKDLLGGPPPTLLPDEAAPRAMLEGGTVASEVAAAYPTHSAAWAALADEAWGRGSVVESYAYARVGYHRGLDALRRNGWKGFGPVPWSHGPNQGFLRALYALGRAAGAINESDEAARISAFLDDSDPAARQALS